MAELCGLEDASTLRWTRADESDVDATPFWYVDLPSEELARAIASRALLVRGIVEEWGSGADEEACARAAAAYDESRKAVPRRIDDVQGGGGGFRVQGRDE